MSHYSYSTYEQNLKDLSIDLKNKLEDFKKYSCFESNDNFQELTSEGKAFQSKLREDYNNYFELLRVLFIKHPKSIKDNLNGFHDDILLPINRDSVDSMFDFGCNEEFSEACNALDCQIELLDEARRARKHKFIFVPDTNALIYNHILQYWDFNDEEG